MRKPLGQIVSTKGENGVWIDKIARMLRGKAPVVAVIIAVPLLLSGCVGVITADVTLYSDEKWQANVDLTLTQEEVLMAGGEEAIESQLQFQIAEWEQQGNPGSWRKEYKEKNVIYHLSVQGEGWSALNRAVFNNQAQIRYIDRGRVYFFLPLQSAFAQQPLTLRLTGGKIISSNADEVSGRTAIWYDVRSKGGAEATLTEAGQSSPACLGSVGLVVLLIPVTMLATMHRSRSLGMNSDKPASSA